MIITVEQLNSYADSYDSDAVRISLKESYIEAATDAVIEYLSYDPRLQTYSEVFSGTGENSLQLSAKPIDTITSLTISGEPVSLGEIVSVSKNSERIIRTGSVFDAGEMNIVVDYSAGFDPLPGAITLAVLRIATLLLSEANGNIGITSKSFQDQSRTFINYTNWDKYLKPLDAYRIMRLE